jgi:N-methylhydantoinase A
MPGIADSFERTYARRFGEGVGYPEGGIDLTALRLHVEPADAYRAHASSNAGANASAHASGSRDVYWPEHRDTSVTPVFTGAGLPAGVRLTGPALIDYADTTVVLRPGMELTVETGGNLTIEVEA